MRVDSTLMVFEFSALSTFLLANYFKEKGGPFISFCLLAYMAVAVRLSGAYFAIISTLTFLWFWFKNKGSKRVFLGWLILALLFAHPYLKNLQVFSNPIFPFKSPIPNSFYYFTMDSWQSFCNLIYDIPEGLYQMYLLIHVSLGFGTTLWDKFFPFLQAGQKSV